MNSLISGHPWLPLASWGHFPLQPSHVLPKFEVCSSFKTVQTNIIHSPNFRCFGVPRSRHCAWLWKWRCSRHDFYPQEAHCLVKKKYRNSHTRPAASRLRVLAFDLSSAWTECPCLPFSSRGGLLHPSPQPGCPRLWDALYFGLTSVSHFSPTLWWSEILFITSSRHIPTWTVSWHMVDTWSLLVKWVSEWIPRKGVALWSLSASA